MDFLPLILKSQFACFQVDELVQEVETKVELIKEQDIVRSQKNIFVKAEVKAEPLDVDAPRGWEKPSAMIDIESAAENSASSSITPTKASQAPVKGSSTEAVTKVSATSNGDSVVASPTRSIQVTDRKASHVSKERTKRPGAGNESAPSTPDKRNDEKQRDDERRKRHDQSEPRVSSSKANGIGSVQASMDRSQATPEKRPTKPEPNAKKVNGTPQKAAPTNRTGNETRGNGRYDEGRSSETPKKNNEKPKQLNLPSTRPSDSPSKVFFSLFVFLSF